MDVDCTFMGGVEPLPWHFIITHQAQGTTPKSLKSTPNLHRHNSVRVDPYGHQQLMSRCLNTTLHTNHI